MDITLSPEYLAPDDEQEKELARALSYVRNRLRDQIVDTEYRREYKMTTFSTHLDMKEGVALLNELIERFPSVDVSGTCITGVEGRDDSWWSTYRYTKVMGPDGKYTLERSVTTDWA